MSSNVLETFESYIQQNWISVIAQLINAPLYFYLFTVKNDLKFLKLSLVSCIMFGIGYCGISAWSGTVFSLFSLVYLLVSYSYKKHKVGNKIKYITFIFISILIILLNLYFECETLFINKDLTPILCAIASLIHAYIYLFNSVNLKRTRWLFVFSHTLLIIYEIIIVMPLFVVVDILGLISNILELKKFYRE